MRNRIGDWGLGIGDRHRDNAIPGAEISNELEEGYAVLRELRTALTFQQFLDLYNVSKRADEYTLLGAFQDGRCVAVRGYRVLFDFVHGKHVYVDDLVVTEKCRSKGTGTELLHQAEKVAQAADCESLRLCTGIENEAGKRFYEREGWELRSRCPDARHVWI